MNESRLQSLLGWALAPVERTVEALLDPARRERTVILLLVAIAAVYTLYAVLASMHRDIVHDTGELIAWLREPALGYTHPPLSAWVARAWFAVFPLSDWAACLLATTNIALTVWIAWRLFSEWLDDEKRVLALAMFTLIPLITFHALIFNANTVMMPFWAATSLFFLRSVITRDAAQAAFAGIAAAGAMLGKYWSVYLVVGLGIAALLDRRRVAYFKSAAPWITIAAGLIVLAPHLAWLIQGGSSTFDFMRSTMEGPAAAPGRSIRYLIDAAAYVVAPLMVFAATRPGRAALRDVVMPADADRRLVAMAFFIPLVLPTLTNLAVPTRLTAVWTIPGWTLFPVVLLGSPLVRATRTVVVWTVAAAMALPILALLGSPLVAVVSHHTDSAGSPARLRLLTAAVTQAWRRNTDRPLRLVGGEQVIAYGVAFYHPDRPSALWDHLVQLPAGRTEVRLHGESKQRLERDGIVLVCRLADEYCVAAIDRVGQQMSGRREVVELERSFLGIPGRAERFVIVAVPPAR